MDEETKEVIDSLPVANDGWQQADVINAAVFIDQFGRIAIFPKGGGALFVKQEDAEGDVAPFCD